MQFIYFFKKNLVNVYLYILLYKNDHSEIKKKKKNSEHTSVVMLTAFH